MLSTEDIQALGKEIIQPLAEQLRAEFASVIEDNINPQFQAMHERFDRLETRMDHVEGDVATLKSDMTIVKSTMVTQSIFQQEIRSLEDKLMTLVQGEDKKVIALVRMLRQKQVLSEDEVRELFALQPFSQHLV